ncbi:MAG: hypothetical protein MI725_15190, partial [Pirellulales bacterium]|nr:hypothetical protein [Pirellulales bacterium]
LEAVMHWTSRKRQRASKPDAAQEGEVDRLYVAATAFGKRYEDLPQLGKDYEFGLAHIYRPVFIAQLYMIEEMSNCFRSGRSFIYIEEWRPHPKEPGNWRSGDLLKYGNVGQQAYTKTFDEAISAAQKFPYADRNRRVWTREEALRIVGKECPRGPSYEPPVFEEPVQAKGF